MSTALTYCHINSHGIFLNGAPVFQTENTENWPKACYQALAIDYPKFHKMDILSKMAFLGMHVLETATAAIDRYEDNAVALIFANSQSSLATDLKFKESYEQVGNPSPSLFVYTLPNILTGELAIYKKWYGENIFFIEDAFNAELYAGQINSAFRRGNKAVLCGWVDASATSEEALLFFVENTGEAITATTLMNIYKQHTT